MSSQNLNSSFGQCHPGHSLFGGRALCSSLLVLLALGAVQAGAATITVDVGGTCTLANAITAANTDTAIGGCSAGLGADTIDLQTNVTIAAGSLPNITTQIIIQGNGYSIQRTGGTGRIFNLNNPNSNLTLNNVTVSGGNPTGAGGAINVSGAGAILTLNQSTISGNTATSTGGAISISGAGASGTLTQSTISGNTATGAGGAISVTNTATLTVIESTITGNTTSNIGGGISHDGTGAVTVTDSTISGNAASSNGGGIRNLDGGAFTISGSTIANNTAGGDGGGIRNNGSNLTVTNSTIANNTANRGGAISNVNSGAGAVITYSTLSGNAATLTTGIVGGGISNLSSAIMTLAGNVISGNSSPSSSGQEIHNAATISSSAYNLLGSSALTYAQAISGFTPDSTDILATSTVNGGGANPFSKSLADILNSTLASNGGLTQTLALVAASPAINRIPISAPPCAPAGATLDQRGRARGNGVNNGGVACDIGAFEYGYAGNNSNSLMTLISQTKNTNITPDLNYPILSPGGVYTLTLNLRLNSGTPPVHNVFFQVVTLGNNNYLLNADGQPGQVGAELSVPDASLPTPPNGNGNSSWEAGETLTQAFRIGLTNLNRFLFYVDVYSEPQGVNTQSVSPMRASGRGKLKYLGRLEFEVRARDLQP